MKIKEQMKKYRDMKDKELISQLKTMKKELTLLSLKVRVGKLSDNSQVKKAKRNIARVNSIILEKQYGVENE